MKKKAIVYLIITFLYCAVATYFGLKIINDNAILFPDWVVGFFAPGFALGVLMELWFGFTQFIFAQIITFIILFYFLKTLINWLIYEFQKRKS